MKIVCLGWGSLIWDPKFLKIDREWKQDGPMLPIEFTRQSKNGRITLIIDRAAQPLPVLWANMTVDNLDDAITSLQEREEAPKRESIHFVQATDVTNDAIKLTVIDWLRAKNLDAAIWTGLSYNKKVNKGARLSADYVIEHLGNMTNDAARTDAEEYIRNAPKQIKTEYRRRIETELGWKSIEDF